MKNLPTQDLSVLCFGDIVGRPGRESLSASLPALKAKFKPDLVIVNAENSAGGMGITCDIAQEINGLGVDVITLGDHTFDKKDLVGLMDKNPDWIIRPANYPGGTSGLGYTIIKKSEHLSIGVMNVMGRVFLNLPLDCPFRKAEEILDGPLADCKIIICDMHAEATSEKVAFAKYFDGKLSLVFGTHTHVQTADERILPAGTGFICDIGMCGSTEGVIGMDADLAINRFLHAGVKGYQVATENPKVCGIHATIDIESGKTVTIERFQE